MTFSRTGRLADRRGMTLVEIIIVVAILGILAALVAPKFSTAAVDARAANVRTQLRSLRHQIETFRIEHNNTYPSRETLWEQLTSKTTYNGTVDADGKFGPYLLRPPINPFTQSSTVAAPGQGAASDGWEYDESIGFIWAVGFNEDTMTYTAPAGGSGD